MGKERKENYMMKETNSDYSEEGDENKERGNWSGKLDFLLSAIGYAVGLGNVWRFPYRAYDNGGGSFLIPYCIMLVFAGLPLFFIEMGIGQFASLGPISIWRAVPFFRGLGIAMVIISGLVAIYYNMIIAYTLYYFFASLAKEVPWQDCKKGWEKYGCVDRKASCDTNSSEMMEDRKSPSEVYWEREVLAMSDDIDEGGSEFQWKLVLCLLLAWVVIFLCLCKGIKSSGKVVYVTATFPYIVLIILFGRNITLDGAKDGIDFYITPKWDKLQDSKVWYAAAIQIFYSLGVSFGGLETMASYNKFKNNVHRDSLLVAFINCGTSVFAGFVIFSVIGFMAKKTCQAVEDVVDAGPGLAFIAYPEGIAMMPVPPLWSILFFLMLFTLGLDSQFAMMETIITAVVDEFPVLRVGRRKIVFTGVLCIILFLLGLPQCAKNGIYIMNLFDWYSAGFSLVLVAIFEIIAFSFVYGGGLFKGKFGFQRLRSDFELMLGTNGCGGNFFKVLYYVYWLPTWVVITPLLLGYIFVMVSVEYAPVEYNGEKYPAWADYLGWGMVAIAVVWIPVEALLAVCRHGVRQAFKPLPGWGPALDTYRTGRYQGTSADGTDNMASGYTNEGRENPGYEEMENGRF